MAREWTLFLRGSRIEGVKPNWGPLHSLGVLATDARRVRVVEASRPHLIEATIHPDTGERTVLFATARGEHSFTIKDAADEVWAALSNPEGTDK